MNNYMKSLFAETDIYGYNIQIMSLLPWRDIITTNSTNNLDLLHIEPMLTGTLL